MARRRACPLSRLSPVAGDSGSRICSRTSWLPRPRRLRLPGGVVRGPGSFQAEALHRTGDVLRLDPGVDVETAADEPQIEGGPHRIAVAFIEERVEQGRDAVAQRRVAELLGEDVDGVPGLRP